MRVWPAYPGAVLMRLNPLLLVYLSTGVLARAFCHVFAYLCPPPPPSLALSSLSFSPVRSTLSRWMYMYLLVLVFCRASACLCSAPRPNSLVQLVCGRSSCSGGLACLVLSCLVALVISSRSLFLPSPPLLFPSPLLFILSASHNNNNNPQPQNSALIFRSAIPC